MGELKKTTDLVKNILKDKPETRDSDSILYVAVLDHYGRTLSVDFSRIAVTSFFSSYKKYKIPSIETVGRCRRKLQEEYIELRGTKQVQKERRAQELEYRHYASY